MASTSAPLSENLGWLLSRASQTLTSELTAALERVGISPRAHCVLSTAMTGEHTQTELAQKLGLDKTTLLVTLDELERTGLAKRCPSPHDRRVRVITVTKAGERKVAKAEEIAARVHAAVLASIPAKQRKVFVETLGELAQRRYH